MNKFKVIIATTLMLLASMTFADPSTLPDRPNTGDHIAIFYQSEQDGIMIGIDTSVGNYDKEHQVFDVLEVMMPKDHSIVLSTKLSFDCKNHKVKTVVSTAFGVKDQKVLDRKVWADGNEWKEINNGTVAQAEFELLCASTLPKKPKDPRAVDL